MTLLTREQTEQLLANGRESLTRDTNHWPVVKLYMPDTDASWLLTEIDPDDADRAFGLCDLGLGCPEIGFVRLSELARLRGPLGLGVERDRRFAARRGLADYARDARILGRIRT